MMNGFKISTLIVLFAISSGAKALEIVVIGERSSPDQGLINASQQSGQVNGGNQGGYGSAGMNSDKAARDAMEKKAAACYARKSQTPLDESQCRAQANTLMTNYSVANCKDSGGIFSPVFVYSGTYFYSSSAYPAISYATGAQCQQLINAAINQFQTNCTTDGEANTNNACQGIN